MPPLLFFHSRVALAKNKGSAHPSQARGLTEPMFSGFFCTPDAPPAKGEGDFGALAKNKGSAHPSRARFFGAHVFRLFLHPGRAPGVSGA